MKRSLNEIEQTGRKAARGAGLPWGMADETGKAVRWLHVFGLDGVGALVNLFREYDHHDAGGYAPHALQSPWRGAGGPGSPGDVISAVMAGPSLCDCLWTDEAVDITAMKVAQPVLCAGFLGQCAPRDADGPCLEWGGLTLFPRYDRLGLAGEAGHLHDALAEELHMRHASVPEEVEWRAPHIGDAPVDDESWRALEALAWLTYVEDSVESRMSGAGAGLVDND